MSISNYDPHISIDKEIIRLNDPNYSIKTLNFDNINKKITTPFKILSGNNIEKDQISLLSEDGTVPIYENEQLVDWRNWNRLKTIVTEFGGDSRRNEFRNFFELKNSLCPGPLNNVLTTLSLVFYRDPFEGVQTTKKPLEQFDEYSYNMLLQLVYTNSSCLVLTPDYILNKESSINEYLKRIDNSVKTLSDWNKKPIFVPIQINLNVKQWDKILNHYKKNGYSNIWVNFDTEPCNIAYSDSLRMLRNLIKDKFGDTDNVVLYYSHIAKEITPNIRDTQVAASDILTQFNGADIIGVNRAPAGFGSDKGLDKLLAKYNFKDKKEYLKALVYHKNRVFDPDTYYYCNIDNYPNELPLNDKALLKEPINKLFNSIVQCQEVSRVKQYVEEYNPKNVKKDIVKNQKVNSKENTSIDDPHNRLKQYLEKKTAVKENKDANETVFPKNIQTDLNDL